MTRDAAASFEPEADGDYPLARVVHMDNLFGIPHGKKFSKFCITTCLYFCCEMNALVCRCLHCMIADRFSFVMLLFFIFVC